MLAIQLHGMPDRANSLALHLTPTGRPALLTECSNAMLRHGPVDVFFSLSLISAEIKQVELAELTGPRFIYDAAQIPTVRTQQVSVGQFPGDHCQRLARLLLFQVMLSKCALPFRTSFRSRFIPVPTGCSPFGSVPDVERKLANVAPGRLQRRGLPERTASPRIETKSILMPVFHLKWTPASAVSSEPQQE